MPNYKLITTQSRFQDLTAGADPAHGDLLTQLTQGKLGEYDRRAAYLCAVASAWVYSDPQTMADVMARQGLDGNLSIRATAKNDAMFVAATADLVLSEDGTVGVLCFRGTEPLNIINWLTDFTVRPVKVPACQGLVHGGMYRNLMAIWDDIVRTLRRALPQGQATPAVRLVPKPLAIAESSMLEGGVSTFIDRIESHRADTAQASSDEDPLEKVKPALTTLYVTGHSLGGAMAALAAVRLLVDDAYADLRPLLRGVYTFGQPLVADQDFVNGLPSAVQGAVMRHVYDRDIVPRLPPRSMIALAHFGPERAARQPLQPSGDEALARWQTAKAPVPQLSGLFLSGVLSVGDYFVQQFPALRAVHVPYSLENHFPRHYIACSLLGRQSSEFDPPDWSRA